MISAILSRLCCCGTTPPPPPGICGTTSDVPQPWPRRTYTLNISGGLQPQQCNGSFYPLDCDQAVPPVCTPESLKHYYIDACCIPNKGGYNGLREASYSSTGNFSAYFEFDSINYGSIPLIPCSRHIPVSYQEVNDTGIVCDFFSMASVEIQSIGLMSCSKVLDCSTEPPGRRDPCLDISEIQLQFAQSFEARFQIESDAYCETPRTDVCEPLTVGYIGLYRKQKVSSDTHVAVGTYDLVAFYEYPNGSCPFNDACRDRYECGNASQYGVPGTISIGIKPE
jgi:hypothetical protein